MKKIFLQYALTISAGFLLISCDESTIDLNPIGATEVGYFQTVEEMEKGVFGAYASMRDFYSFHGGTSRVPSTIWLLPSDDLTSPGNYPEDNFSGITPDSDRVRRLYAYAYRMIARANAVLEQIEINGAQVYQGNEEIMNIHKGEALFLRGWMFWRLWNIFGTAPIVTERITLLEDAYPSGSQGTELLDQAIMDMEEAADLLPDTWDDANLGRATRNSALGFLGKILVFRGTVNNNQADFSEAITAFDAISGVALVDHYNKNFNYLYENNEESLFEYQAGSTQGGVNAFVSIEAFPAFDLTVWWGFFNRVPVWIGNDFFTATQSLQDAYEAGDPRIIHVYDTGAVDLINITKYVKDGEFARNAAGGPLNPARNNGYNINNPRILRYADVLLLKAEAIVRSGGNLAEAVDLVNQIRTRARFSTEDGSEAAVPANLDAGGADASTVLEWVFEERRRELALEEGHRWWDLRRRHLAGEIDLTNWDFETISSDFEFEEFNINYPLPEIEVIENPNLSQNTGY
ncbi:MAG: RagB/SusD family nutrient uptake outer membrane protein [Cyclobacteriaceae bacterium]